MQLQEFEKCFKAASDMRKSGHDVTAKLTLQLAERRWIAENGTKLPYHLIDCERSN